MEGTVSNPIAAHQLPISQSASQPPVLFVVVDTEEEFDWNAPFSRHATAVTHMAEIDRLQSACEMEGAQPIYVMDYAIATAPAAVEVLGGLHRDGRARLGAHLHAWVNPPFDEDVCARNSYQGNLPQPLERAKLTVLTEAIRANFGIDPRIHKAGRYGFGDNTGGIIADLGYTIDMSPMSGFDLREDGGPDYMAMPSQPCWLDRPGGVLELPNTGGFTGMLSRWGAYLYPIANSRLGRVSKANAIAARLSVLGRVRLSPEGHTLHELQRLTEKLLTGGVRIFVLSLHSPSVQVMGTPYVGDASARDRLIGTVQGFVRYFRDGLGGDFPSPFDYRDSLIYAPQPTGDMG